MRGNFFDIQVKVEKKVLSLLFLAFSISVFLTFVFMLAGKGDMGLTGYLKGADYINFYAGGKIIVEGNSKKLYDETFFKNELKKFPLTESQLGSYPPSYSSPTYYLYSLFAFFDLNLSIFLSVIFFLIMYLISISLLIFSFSSLKKYYFIIILLSPLFPPFFSVFLTGQPSILWLFILSLSFYLYKKDFNFLSGAVLSLFICKPNFYIVVFFTLILSFRFKEIIGFLSGTLFLALFFGIWDSFAVWNNWISYSFDHYIFRIQNDSSLLERRHTTKSFFQFFYQKEPVLTLLGNIGSIVGSLTLFFPSLYIFLNKNKYSKEIFFSIFSISAVLANPHILDYDLVILALPAMFFLDLLISKNIPVKKIIGFYCALFLIPVFFTLVSGFTKFQFSVVLMWGIIIFLTFCRIPSNFYISKRH